MLRSSLLNDNSEPTFLSNGSTSSDDLVFPNQFPNPIITPTPIVSDSDFQISSDDKFVYFIRDASDLIISSIFPSVPNIIRTTIDDPTQIIEVSERSLAQQTDFSPSAVEDFILSSDDRTVIYTLSNIFNPNLLLATSSFNGSNNRLLPTEEFGSIDDFTISNNNEFVVFTTSSGVDDLQNLYSIDISEPEPFCFPIKTQNDNFVTICL